MRVVEDIVNPPGNWAGGGSIDNWIVDADMQVGRKIVGREYKCLLHAVGKDF